MRETPSSSCAFCGCPDSRHRTWDMVKERFIAGESLAALATDYGVSLLSMEQLLRQALTQPRSTRDA